MVLTGNKEVFLPITIAFFILALGWTIVGFFINLTQWDLQIKRFEGVRKIKKLLKIKRTQFEELKGDWIKYLSVEYPDFEKGVFEKMSPQEKSDLKMYFVKYPELSASSMFTLLIQKISGMSDEIFHLDKDLEWESAQIRSQFQNRWLIIKPEIPKDIKDMVYRLEEAV
jgi:hypothetical protein